MRKFERNSYALTAQGIDDASEFMASTLQRAGVSRRDALRLRLSAEEILLDWQAAGDMDDHFEVEISRRMRQVNFTMRCGGRPRNPMDKTRESDMFGTGDLGRAMLENIGLSPSWQYKDGVNVIFAAQKIEKRMSQLAQVAAAAVLALILGALGTMMPQGIKNLLLEDLINPVFNAFLGLLSCIVGPMMFLSMVWGIFNIGDAKQLGVIGRKLLGRFMLISTLMGVCCLGAALIVFDLDIGSGSGGEDVLKAIVEMVLGIIPSNIVEPFLSGNTLQILAMGAAVGVAMILLRDRMQTLSQIVEQSNAIIQYILSAIGSMVPGFIFLSVLRMILQGTLMGSAAGLLLAIALSIALTLIEMAAETLSVVRLGISPVRMFGKLSPTYLIALSTASSAAAFPTMMACCEEKLGVDTRLARFALPFGSVVFMPQAVNMFILIPLFVAKGCGVELTLTSLLLCLINAVVLSVAAPPIPGGALSCYTLMFMQLGIPLDQIALAIAANVVLDFTVTAGNVYDLMVQLTHGAKHMGMIDGDVLRS